MVIIIRGISGSGKSTVVNDFVNEPSDMLNTLQSPAAAYLRQLKVKGSKKIYSADNYFIVKGVYKFEQRYLATAHHVCLRSFAEDLPQPKNFDNALIVDNTNCHIADVSPYISLGAAYAHDIHVVTIFSDNLRKCFDRNTHEVPFDSIVYQDIALRKSIAEWPGRFPQQIFPY